MLQIQGIKKVYRTENLVQQALKGVSLSLRDNEFVAILGQSGSGKTTLLNIIGGLDRYDEGDLIINGVSTKKYSDRDWDSYRNHSVGFVFQSYNLIPHQTVLSNVELALTISGISSKERTERAAEVLRKVGLGEHMHKKPSQLSGGQMQRVAIARALVNDPDILLADEPTGALDSDTSIQVMDLLKEVASDRLVVMVTHNPELAEQYATRIVTLKDGMITSDSAPFEPEGDMQTVHKNMGKASMSFLTALLLSFNNLWTKKTRTILVSFAGSIGIIGIAMILAMSHGANEYIHREEEESLQSYPLTINSTSLNLTSMYANNMGLSGEESENAKDVTELRTVTNLLSGVNNNDLRSLMAYFESDECDIYDYVQALEYGYGLTPQIFQAYKDGYRQVNPDSSFEALGFTSSQSSTNSLLSTFSNTDSFYLLPRESSIYKNSYDVKAGSWPESYDECVVVISSSGRVTDMTLYALGLKDPTELDEMVKAFSDGTSTEINGEPDSYDYDDFLGIEFNLLSASRYYAYDQEYKVWTDRSDDEEYMNSMLDDADTLRVVGVVQAKEDNSSPILYQGIYCHASVTDHMIDLAAQSDIVKAQLENPDINVFTGKPFGEEDENSGELNLSSLFNVDKDAINDTFDFGGADFDMSEIDFGNVDLSSVDLSSSMSMDDFGTSFPSLSSSDIEKLFDSVNFNVSAATLQELFSTILSGYQDYAAPDARADVSVLPSSFARYLRSEDARTILVEDLSAIIAEKSRYVITTDDLILVIESVMSDYPSYLESHGLTDDIEYSHLSEYLNSSEAQALINSGADSLRDKVRSMLITTDDVVAVSADLIKGYESYADNNDLPNVSYILQSFTSYLSTDEAKSLILSTVTDAVDTNGVEKILAQYADTMSSQIGAVMSQMISAVSDNIAASLSTGIRSLMSNMSENVLSVFSFDTDTLSDMLSFNMTGEELRDLLVSLMSRQESSYPSNLKLLGYADRLSPSTITIFPLDYESKGHIKDLISDYNARMEANGEDDKVIRYTDLVDTLMGSITTIIDAISYVLIAFVAISLVVSSIMIGVITYISVLERRKEIGILRAIGASKRNISQVFNAETFIIGTLAGIIGIGITELLIIPANIILKSLTNGVEIYAILPPVAAIALILLSIILTLIGGIIPSRKAAKSDPVTALRSE